MVIDRRLALGHLRFARRESFLEALGGRRVLRGQLSGLLPSFFKSRLLRVALLERRARRSLGVLVGREPVWSIVVSRLGPNGLIIEKETTHRLLSRRRRASMA